MATTAFTPWTMPEGMKIPNDLSPPSASDREAITDCVHRLMLGIDTNDQEMFDSSLALDAQWELHIKTLDGLAEIHEQFFKSVTELDTTHYVTNIRIHAPNDGSEASASTLYEAHHYRFGRGIVPGAARYSTGGVYFIRLGRDSNAGDAWRIKYMKMKPIWTEGDRILVMQH